MPPDILKPTPERQPSEKAARIRLKLIEARIAIFRADEMEDQSKTVISDPHPFLDPLLDDLEKILKGEPIQTHQKA